MSCCVDGGWCGNKYHQLEQTQQSDHLCKLSRMRAGIIPRDVRVPASFSVEASGMYSFYAKRHLNSSISCSGSTPGWQKLPVCNMSYPLQTTRMDTLWMKDLGGR